jgi:two-component system sensor histidine kinase DctS
VHEFVKKREPLRQEVAIASLLDSIRALIELQARQSYVSFRAEIPADLPPVRADRVMIEQVLLNLTRNGIEAMQHVPPQRRILNVVAAYDEASAQVSVAVIDQGTAYRKKWRSVCSRRSSRPRRKAWAWASTSAGLR